MYSDAGLPHMARPPRRQRRPVASHPATRSACTRRSPATTACGARSCNETWTGRGYPALGAGKPGRRRPATAPALASTRPRRRPPRAGAATATAGRRRHPKPERRSHTAARRAGAVPGARRARRDSAPRRLGLGRSPPHACLRRPQTTVSAAGRARRRERSPPAATTMGRSGAGRSPGSPPARVLGEPPVVAYRPVALGPHSRRHGLTVRLRRLGPRRLRVSHAGLQNRANT